MVLLFYQFPTEPESQVIVDTFHTALSKFECATALVGDQPNISSLLQAFSPGQSNFIMDVVQWIRELLL